MRDFIFRSQTLTMYREALIDCRGLSAAARDETRRYLRNEFETVMRANQQSREY